MTYQIAVCDDEPIFLQAIAEQIDQIMTRHHISYSLKCFQNSTSLFESITQDPFAFDLILLDILIGKDNGVDFAASLRKAGNSVNIAFITCSSDYLLEGYTVEAIGYLLKPIDPPKLEETLLRAFKKSESRSIAIPTPTSTVMFRPEEILYVEVTGKTLYLHTLTATSLFSGVPLTLLEHHLTPGLFFRCHRSYIVSLAAIRSICRYEITLKNGERIPVSRSRYVPLQEALLTWTADRNLNF